jgi:hypothetical protein
MKHLPLPFISESWRRFSRTDQTIGFPTIESYIPLWFLKEVVGKKFWIEVAEKPGVF